MKADFSIDRFDRSKHFNRVLKQQGRVDLDSDWNEQTAIAAHHLRTALIDLVGAAAGPIDHAGFGLVDWTTLPTLQADALRQAGFKPSVGDFIIGAGRYYVAGLLVENEAPTSYTQQPEWRAVLLTAGKSYLVYLDVYERHITYIEDDAVREVALGGPDTCTRVKTTWQVKVLETSSSSDKLELTRKLEELKKQLAEEKAKATANAATVKKLTAQIAKLEPRASDTESCATLLQPLQNRKSGGMRARIEPTEDDTPCVLAPEARYRGLENQLYRIEIHRGTDNADHAPPSFKWSRENGAVVTRWLGVHGTALRVACTRGFAAHDWIEVSDGSRELQGEAGTLYRVIDVEGDLLQLDKTPTWDPNLVNPFVRRWDQRANDELTLRAGAIEITPAKSDTDGWIELEAGIEVQFLEGEYRTGDYWLIPARAATGSIEWPQVDGVGKALPPRGIVHHYAALARIEVTGEEPYVKISEDCRCLFAPLACNNHD